jgi:hypothetical protein
MAEDFQVGPRKFFDETPEDEYEAETIPVDYIIFSDLKNYTSLCGVKSQLA